jgi:hypothetical protein
MARPNAVHTVAAFSSANDRYLSAGHMPRSSHSRLLVEEAALVSLYRSLSPHIGVFLRHTVSLRSVAAGCAAYSPAAQSLCFTQVNSGQSAGPAAVQASVGTPQVAVGTPQATVGTPPKGTSSPAAFRRRFFTSAK